MKRIYLKREINPDYYSISEEYNKLMDRWNDINSKIHNFKIPKFFLFLTKKKLENIGREGKALQNDYVQWNKKASSFFLEPKYIFEEGQEVKELTYLHFTNSLQFLINSMHEYMILLVSNYNNRYSQYREQLNFIIAITAFIIGILGLSFSTYSTFNNSENLIREQINNISGKTININSALKTVNSKLDSIIYYNKSNLNKKENMKYKESEISTKLSKKKPNPRFKSDTRSINQ